MNMPDDFALEWKVAQLAAVSYEPQSETPRHVICIRHDQVGHVQYAVYEDDLSVYVVYAGSNQFYDWMRHVKIYRVPLPDSMQVGSETLTFHRAWQKDAASTECLVAPYIAEAHEAGKSIWFAGHSYGGPLAAWMAFQVSVIWPDARLRVRTYGAPKPASSALRKVFTERIPDAIAYRNPGDVVTRVPFTGKVLGRVVKVPFRLPAHSMRHYLSGLAKLSGR